MLNSISVLLSSILCSICIVYTITKIGDFKSNRISFFISTILISIVIFLSYIIKYNSEINVLKVIVFILIIKYIYKGSVYRSVISTLMSMLLMLIGEIVTSLILISFITVNQIRTTWYFLLTSNSIVCIVMMLLINISVIRKGITKIINKTDKKGRISTLLLFSLSILMIIYLLYNISVNYNWNDKYIITILIMISYIVISLIFFKDKIEYNMLEEKYDALFDYFSEISESIDDLNLTTHEYKNQIAIVSSYIENKKYKKAKEYINDMAISINKDEGLLVNLSDIPTGGLKGLLYYKIIVAKNQKVEIVLDAGKNIKKLFKKLSEDEMKIITRIIGVYIDNAVSEAKKQNKIVNIEIYNLDNELYFTISNKINKNLNIDEIGKRGFTTKGKGHGQGLYLVNRIINKNNWLRNENKIINNYYVCKLIINTKNIGK